MIKPFRSLRYHRPVVEKISDYIAPPYDVITPEGQEDLYSRSEFNIARIDYPKKEKGADIYKESARLMNEWIEKDVLVVESKPAIYVLEDYYIDWEGYRRIRRGFIALFKVEDFEEGNIFPHERTFEKHKEDRFKLLEATDSQFNPVFSFYSDENREVTKILKKVVDHRLPDWNFRYDDGATRTMWTLTDPLAIQQISKAMESKKLFIADGHHRYSTALNYSKMMDEKNDTHGKDKPYNYTLMYFVNTENEGLSILMAHRMLKNLPDSSEQTILDKLSDGFVIKEIDYKRMTGIISNGTDPYRMVIQIGPKFFCIDAKKEAIEANEELNKMHETVRVLNVSICQEMIIKPLVGSTEDILDHMGYETDPEKVNENIHKGKYDVAIYMAPVLISDLEKVAKAKQVMPQKSTYFYPKLLTGLVIYNHSFNNV